MLKRVGANWIGKCPLHVEKTGSLVVTPSKNLFHCFGCGAAGSPIDWAMRMQNLSFREAVEWLARENNLALTNLESEKELKRKEVALMPNKEELEKMCAWSIAELRSWAITVYHQELLKNEIALSYLESRGLKDLEMIEKFRLGYSTRSVLMELSKQRDTTTVKFRERLQEAGILRESGHEHFNNCIIVPIINELGEVTEIYGRKAIRKSVQQDGYPVHLYLKGKHEGVWNAQEFLSGDYKEVILCEALLDAMTFWRIGYRNVTASYGVEGFTMEHLELFHRASIEKVLIAYDSDSAGISAAERLAKRLNDNGLDCARIEFPGNKKDANATALAAIA